MTAIKTGDQVRVIRDDSGVFGGMVGRVVADGHSAQAVRVEIDLDVIGRTTVVTFDRNDLALAHD